MIEFLGVPGCPQPSRPRSSRVAARYGYMLPTIEEEESYDDECSLYGSSSGSVTSMSWSSDLNAQCGSPNSNDYAQYRYEHAAHGQQHQMQMQPNWQSHQELDEDELLLAAIEIRLQELIALRDQRKAAFRATSSAATGPPAAQAAAVSAGPAPITMQQQQLLQGKQQHHQQAPCADLAQHLHNLASTQQLSDAGQDAAAKLEQMYAVQQMQAALQQELVQLLQQGCY